MSIPTNDPNKHIAYARAVEAEEALTAFCTSLLTIAAESVGTSREQEVSKILQFEQMRRSVREWLTIREDWKEPAEQTYTVYETARRFVAYPEFGPPR